MKIEQKKVWGPEWGPQVEQTALLASPIYIGQAQREENTYEKTGLPKGWGSLSPMRVLSLSLSLSSLHVFGLACPQASRMYFPAIF